MRQVAMTSRVANLYARLQARSRITADRPGPAVIRNALSPGT
jgi:hypothetical protein